MKKRRFSISGRRVPAYTTPLPGWLETHRNRKFLRGHDQGALQLRGSPVGRGILYCHHNASRIYSHVSVIKRGHRRWIIGEVGTRTQGWVSEGIKELVRGHW
jgi:hypothetical protein